MRIEIKTQVRDGINKAVHMSYVFVYYSGTKSWRAGEVCVLEAWWCNLLIMLVTILQWPYSNSVTAGPHRSLEQPSQSSASSSMHLLGKEEIWDLYKHCPLRFALVSSPSLWNYTKRGMQSDSSWLLRGSDLLPLFFTSSSVLLSCTLSGSTWIGRRKNNLQSDTAAGAIPSAVKYSFLFVYIYIYLLFCCYWCCYFVVIKTPLWRGCFILLIFRFPSNSSHSIILWFCDTLTAQLISLSVKSSWIGWFFLSKWHVNGRDS